MNYNDYLKNQTRRHFLKGCSMGLGAMWLNLANNQLNAAQIQRDPARPLAALTPHFAPKAKRVIYLHMAGSPSQLELFDYKPDLKKLDGKECPKEFLEGKRFAFIQGVPRMLGPQFPFKQVGESGQWVSDRLPHFQKVIDEVCVIRSMHTDQFNHAPAQLLLHTGNPNLGNPSMGSWVTYGLGTENENLPGFVVLVSGGKTPSAGKSIWGSGFLPSVYQGVQCRSKGDPVLYLSNPKGIPQKMRRHMLDALKAINEETLESVGDPETRTRIAQYEMAYRMQIHASEAFDISNEPKDVHEFYGTQPGKESFANNCLLARRLAERGVRFIQLFHWGWDSHGAGENEALNGGFIRRCKETDQSIAALISDLKQRGLLDETLIIWGGEFGRTPMRENRGGTKMRFVGRDHNPGAFTMWMAGGGIQPGISYGETDPIGYQVATDKMSARDMQATVLHLLGFNHQKLSYPFRGLDQTLPGVTEASRVVKEILL